MNKRAAIMAIAVVAALPLLPSLGLAEEWKPVEKVVAYRISGASGIELYHSIGENGPKAGSGRAIAVTNFDLKWSRNYQPQPDGSCQLVAAKPHLTISYHLPKPAAPLTPEVQARWHVFAEGVDAHERIHGAMIVETVQKIRSATVGASAAQDPGCKKVRREVDQRTVPLVQAHQDNSRAFDRRELGEGGAVQSLVLALVNG